MTTPSPFGHDWADSARTVADVISISVVDELTWPRVALGVARNPDNTREYQVRRLHVRPTRYFGGLSASVNARTIDRLMRVATADHGPIDLLHTHFYAMLRMIGRMRSPIPFVHTEHSPALTGLSNRSPSRSGLRMAQRGFARASTVICVSRFLAESVRHIGVPCRLRVIGNPIDVETFRPAPRRDNHRVVTVARLEPDKRIDLMLDAFARRGRCDLHLEIIGTGPDRSQLESQAKRLGIADRVVFTGQLPRARVAQQVSTARLYLSSGADETFGVAVAETLAAGVPVIAPRVGALPELVSDDDGILVEYGDAEALAAGIDDVLQRDFDASAARQRIVQRFSPEAIGEQLRDVYTEAATNSPAG